MNKVLIVIDCQNDFIYGTLGTPEARAIVPNVVQRCKQARQDEDLIIFTKDVHYEEDYANSLEGAFVPRHCMANENGHWLIEELQNFATCVIVKSTYGYRDWHTWKERFNKVDAIELCGVCTDICVISNALILRSLYPATPISVDASCCAGLTPEKHQAALEVMKSCNIKIRNED